MIRAITLLLAFAIASPAWVESVEFPWDAIPQPFWEGQLVWLKNAGITHLSLPPAKDAAQLTDVIRIIKRLGMEADLEGAVPDSMTAQTRAHGGPLTDPLPGKPVRLSALAADSFTRARLSIASGTQSLIWTDVLETLGSTGYKPGALSFTAQARPAATAIRRDAQLAAYWNKTFGSLTPTAGGGAATPGPVVQQFAAEAGTSVVSVVNNGASAWTGELRVLYPPAKRIIGIPGLKIGAHDALWLPVNVPLTAGPLCRDCTKFPNGDHLVYATAELTAMEYENGILAMEFAAPSEGEVLLQLSQEPSGPLVAGGKPSKFEWDDKNMRARLSIPAGSGADKHVRIGLAIEPPDSTAFFDSARVLMIGETNQLTAQFSSDAIAQRSRLRVSPPFENSQVAGKDELAMTYTIIVPDTAVNGDYADLAIEADGMQMSHARPQLLRPVSLTFPDAVTVRAGANAVVPVFPATVTVSQRAGRELLIGVHNNAPEIRTFVLQPKVEGLEFSPEKLEVTVGVSTSRDVSFRVFAKDATAGLHSGAIQVSGAASWSEPAQFVVLPLMGEVTWSSTGFSFLESAKVRATFMPGRWLEYINKDNNQNALPVGGRPFEAGIPARLDMLKP